MNRGQQARDRVARGAGNELKRPLLTAVQRSGPDAEFRLDLMQSQPVSFGGSRKPR